MEVISALRSVYGGLDEVTQTQTRAHAWSELLLQPRYCFGVNCGDSQSDCLWR